MGAKDSKPSFVSYDDAVKRVSDSELRRIREAFKRCAGTNGTSLSLEAFVHEVLCDGVPYEVAEWLYQACGGTKRGITFRDLLCGIVVLTKGNLEEKIKFLWTLYVNNQNDNGTYIYKRDFARSLQLENTSLPVIRAQRTAEILPSLFGSGEKVTFEQFRSWLLIHKDATVLSQWLLSNRGNVVQDLETPTFYQSLAGVTHLEERDIIELEKCFWSLRSGSPSGQLDLTALLALLSPPLAPAAAAGVLLALDDNRDGHVDFKELCCGLSAACRGPRTERLKFCFKIFDMDQDGVLNMKELTDMVDILCTVANEAQRDQESRASTPEVEDAEPALEKAFEPEAVLLDLKGKLVAVPRDGRKPTFQLGPREGEEIIVKQEAAEGGGVALTLEDFLIWSVESADAAVAPFLQLLVEACHVVLGLRPQCPHRQRDIVMGWLRRAVARGYAVGQFWYLVGAEWWAAWRLHAAGGEGCCRDPPPADDSLTTTSTESMGSLLWRADSVSVGSAGSSGVGSVSRARAAAARPPGPVDNKRLLAPPTTGAAVRTLTGEGGLLRRDVTLAQHRDFELLPDPLWRALAAWHGGPDPLPRQVIRPPNSDVELELYPIQLLIYRHVPSTQRVTALGGAAALAAGGPPERQLAYTAAFSRLATVRQVTEFLCGALGLAREDVRLWALGSSAVLLDDERPALGALRPLLGERPRVLLERRGPDLTWPEEIGALSGNRATERRETLVAPNLPGATGLHNLGNTCYMNAALQALFNTGPLVQYFNAGLHLYDLNTTNPLGTRGVLALRFGELCKEVWSMSARSVAPLRLRVAVARHAPLLAPGGQHDAQELLAWLLDALHEDLNCAPPSPEEQPPPPEEQEEQPPEEQPPPQQGEDAAAAAEAAWAAWARRNRSLPAALFYGQLRSRVRCAACGAHSVRHDAFNMLSVPLPMERAVPVLLPGLRLTFIHLYTTGSCARACAARRAARTACATTPSTCSALARALRGVRRAQRAPRRLQHAVRAAAHGARRARAAARSAFNIHTFVHYGQLRSRVRCAACGAHSVRHDAFNMLSVPLPMERAVPVLLPGLRLTFIHLYTTGSCARACAARRAARTACATTPSTCSALARALRGVRRAQRAPRRLQHAVRAAAHGARRARAAARSAFNIHTFVHYGQLRSRVRCAACGAHSVRHDAFNMLSVPLPMERAVPVLLPGLRLTFIHLYTTGSCARACAARRAARTACATTPSTCSALARALRGVRRAQRAPRRLQHAVRAAAHGARRARAAARSAFNIHTFVHYGQLRSRVRCAACGAHSVRHDAFNMLSVPLPMERAVPVLLPGLRLTFIHLYTTGSCARACAARRAARTACATTPSTCSALARALRGVRRAQRAPRRLQHAVRAAAHGARRARAAARSAFNIHTFVHYGQLRSRVRCAACGAHSVRHDAFNMLSVPLPMERAVPVLLPGLRLTFIHLYTTGSCARACAARRAARTACATTPSTCSALARALRGVRRAQRAPRRLQHAVRAAAHGARRARAAGPVCVNIHTFVHYGQLRSRVRCAACGAHSVRHDAFNMLSVPLPMERAVPVLLPGQRLTFIHLYTTGSCARACAARRAARTACATTPSTCSALARALRGVRRAQRAPRRLQHAVRAAAHGARRARAAARSAFNIHTFVHYGQLRSRVRCAACGAHSVRHDAFNMLSVPLPMERAVPVLLPGQRLTFIHLYTTGSCARACAARRAARTACATTPSTCSALARALRGVRRAQRAPRRLQHAVRAAAHGARRARAAARSAFNIHTFVHYGQLRSRVRCAACGAHSVRHDAFNMLSVPLPMERAVPVLLPGLRLTFIHLYTTGSCARACAARRAARTACATTPSTCSALARALRGVRRAQRAPRRLQHAVRAAAHGARRARAAARSAFNIHTFVHYGQLRSRVRCAACGAHSVRHDAFNMLSVPLPMERAVPVLLPGLRLTFIHLYTTGSCARACAARRAARTACATTPSTCSALARALRGVRRAQRAPRRLQHAVRAAAHGARRARAAARSAFNIHTFVHYGQLRSRVRCAACGAHSVRHDAFNMLSVPLPMERAVPVLLPGLRLTFIHLYTTGSCARACAARRAARTACATTPSTCSALARALRGVRRAQRAPRRLQHAVRAAAHGARRARAAARSAFNIHTFVHYGQLRSRVRCAACGAHSVRHDAFNMLSVPLPMERAVPVLLPGLRLTFIHLYTTGSCARACAARRAARTACATTPSTCLILLDGSVPVRYGVRVNTDGTYLDLKQNLSKLCALPPESILLVELAGSQIGRVLGDSAKVRPHCELVAYQLPPPPAPAAHPAPGECHVGGKESLALVLKENIDLYAGFSNYVILLSFEVKKLRTGSNQVVF
ncbi:hypothetical protein ACJJTC_005160 [Scirpophaga incertulas]